MAGLKRQGAWSVSSPVSPKGRPQSKQTSGDVETEHTYQEVKQERHYQLAVSGESPHGGQRGDREKVHEHHEHVDKSTKHPQTKFNC